MSLKSMNLKLSVISFMCSLAYLITISYIFLFIFLGVFLLVIVYVCTNFFNQCCFLFKFIKKIINVDGKFSVNLTIIILNHGDVRLIW